MKGHEPPQPPDAPSGDAERRVAALARRLDRLDRQVVEQREFTLFSAARVERLLTLGLDRIERKMDALTGLLLPPRRRP